MKNKTTLVIGMMVCFSMMTAGASLAAGPLKGAVSGTSANKVQTTVPVAAKSAVPVTNPGKPQNVAPEAAKSTIPAIKDLVKMPVTVLEPKAGQTPYVPGWPLTIRWKYEGDPPGLAKLILLKGNQAVKTFTEGVSWGTGGEGKVDVAMPENEYGFNLYRVRVVSSTNNLYGGVSEQFASMPVLKVVDPIVEGQNWKIGEVYRITWKYSGGCGNKVSIKLIEYSSVMAYDLQASWPIGSIVGWHGYFEWRIPSSIPAGDYRIYLKSETSVCNDRTAYFHVIH